MRFRTDSADKPLATALEPVDFESETGLAVIAPDTSLTE
jgi:hypothetical protein